MTKSAIARAYPIVYIRRMTSPEQQLTQFREQIDTLDETIAKALIARCGIVRNVAALKAAHWPADCHIRSGREGQMHRAVAERFAGTDIPPIAALAIWRQFIGAATQIESPLRIATLAENAHHFWLAREYFGVGCDIAICADLDALIRRIDARESNIVLLPAPIDGVWPQAKTLHAYGLSLFASLPVSTQPMPFAPALAFARITPEPSGDDISYFLRGDHVITADGFQQTHERDVFIGAHPRPISLFNSPPEGESARVFNASVGGLVASAVPPTDVQAHIPLPLKGRASDPKETL